MSWFLYCNFHRPWLQQPGNGMWLLVPVEFHHTDVHGHIFFRCHHPFIFLTFISNPYSSTLSSSCCNAAGEVATRIMSSVYLRLLMVHRFTGCHITLQSYGLQCKIFTAIWFKSAAKWFSYRKSLVRSFETQTLWSSCWRSVVHARYASKFHKVVWQQWNGDRIIKISICLPKLSEEYKWHHSYGSQWTTTATADATTTPWTIKTCHLVFDYNSGVSWSIFIIFVPVERGRNALQFSYLTTWWRHNSVTIHVTKFYLIQLVLKIK